MFKFVILIAILINCSLSREIINQKNYFEENIKITENLDVLQDSCGNPTNGIHYFTIGAEYQGKSLNIMALHYDATRRLATSSTQMMNGLNQESNAISSRFRYLPCPELSGKQMACSSSFRMTPAQAAKSNNTAWDRGHLTPARPFYFSQTAVDNTYYCPNVAPQEPWTNQQTWRRVEDRVLSQFVGKSGFVSTGTCSQDNTVDGPTEEGYITPSCFWKLVCYKDNSNTVRVIGFVADNTLFNNNNEALKRQRCESVATVLSQREVKSKIGTKVSNLVNTGWTHAQQYLIGNRNDTSYPLATQCQNALDASAAVKQEWQITCS